MDKKALLQDEPVNNRAALLRSMADKVETKQITRDFTPEQLVSQKDDLAAISVELENVRDEFSDVKKRYQNIIKESDKRRKQFIKEIKEKCYLNEETVYGIANQVDGVMEFFDAEGYLVASRRLTPEERQGTMRELRAVNG